MMMSLLVVAMALQVRDVVVEVRSTSTNSGLRAKVIVEGADPPQAPRVTNIEGRTTFPGLNCSTETRFRAQSSEPTHLNPSPTKRGCGLNRPPNVTLRIQP